jgi:hypothetical protein
VEAGSLTGTQTFEASGPHTAGGTVADRAGNVSATAQLTVQVDATAPDVQVHCPATATVGESGITATVTASDGESGLATDPSGTVPISTERAGPQTVTRTAIDNAGHEATRSCTTQVRESPPEYGRCTKLSGEVEGGKTVYHGRFGATTCLAEISPPTGKYEWLSGAVRTGFKTTLLSTTASLESANGTRVNCTGESSSGTITSAKTVGNVVIKLTGCGLGGVSEARCTTPGRPEGEIQTKKLEGVLGIERIVKEKPHAGLDLYPPGKTGAFAEYACGLKAPVMLTGSVIAQMPTDKVFSAGKFKYAAARGRQKPESFLSGERQVLTNNNGEQVGLAYSASQVNEEPLEINAYF